jgi:hypothetical protein
MSDFVIVAPCQVRATGDLLSQIPLRNGRGRTRHGRGKPVWSVGFDERCPVAGRARTQESSPASVRPEHGRRKDNPPQEHRTQPAWTTVSAGATGSFTHQWDYRTLTAIAAVGSPSPAALTPRTRTRYIPGGTLAALNSVAVEPLHKRIG